MPSQYINVSGTGLCGISTNALPQTTYTVSLNGSGPDYNQYTQVWQGSVVSYCIVPIVQLPFLCNATSTNPISYPAKGCCN
jgi:hypothetical protein